jgi:hypothetical protein
MFRDTGKTHPVWFNRLNDLEQKHCMAKLDTIELGFDLDAVKSTDREPAKANSNQ